MSPNDGKNIIDLNAVRAHKREDRELDFIPLTSRQNSRPAVNRSTTRRPTPRRASTSKEKRNVRNSCSHSKRKYQSSLKKNYIKVTKLVAAGSLAVSLALGGFAGYQINNHNTANIEYNLNEYNPTNMFNSTNNLVKTVAQDTYFDAHPDKEDSFKRYNLESYNEISVANNGDITLRLNYSRFDSSFSGGVDSKSVDVKLPKDFGKDVYLPYKALRETSSNATEEEKDKMSYWLKINSNITDLSDGLEHYIENTQDKEYAEAAKTALDNSRINSDDDGRDL